jgi:signal transduction histidine kinase
MSVGNILIVEDENIIALDIKRTLTRAGYNIVGIAICANEAIQQAEQSQPDLVLMDISIEGDRDGIETATQLHELYQIPIIYLTAHADERTLSRAKATPTFGYVHKPFNRQELTTMIEIAISKHKAEQAIRQALKEQQELSELKSRFISIVSHEVRNPLNIVLVSAELLEQYIELARTDKQQLCLQRIRESVGQINDLVTDVLALGEAESTDLYCQPESIDLVQFCSTILEVAKFQANDRYTITLSVREKDSRAGSIETPSSIQVYLDTKLLRPVLANLLSNAIKYSPPGSAIQISCIYSEKEVVFQIQDQGIGIPISDQSRLFKSFYRASNVRKISGTGLGLSIVKQYVELHGGQVTLESAIDEGTTVTVTIPLIETSSMQ